MGETEERVYTVQKNVQSALKSNSLSLKTNKKCHHGERILLVSNAVDSLQNCI